MTAEQNVTTVAARVNVLLATAKADSANGLTWAEFGRLLVQLLHIVVDGLDAVRTLTGPEKKAIALTAAATLFDSFADLCVPLAAKPAWLIIRPAVRTLILAIAGGAVEALLNISRSST